MKTVEKTIQDVKRELMMSIILGLRHSQTSLDEAQYLAQDFLSIFPISDMKDLLQKLSTLSKTYKEIRPAYIKHANEYYKEQKVSILKVVPSFIKNGEVKEALILLRGGTT